MTAPIDDARKWFEQGACFVAGTLVHTKEGLKPIEQIKVGDYVLSKSENGAGEPAYKRVTRTCESEGKEIWYVHYRVVGEKQSGFIFATAEHPFWVKRSITHCCPTVL